MPVRTGSTPADSQPAPWNACTAVTAAEEAGLHRPADTGALALVQRRHHAEGAEQAGEEVGDRRGRRASARRRRGGQAHQPGLGLHDLVEPGTGTVGAAGTEAGDRERHQTRVRRAQVGRVETEAGEQAWPVVLDQDVGAGAESAEPVGASGLLRSSRTERLPRLAERKYADSRCSSSGEPVNGSQPRLSSPAGGSTLSTSAPTSASIIVA